MKLNKKPDPADGSLAGSMLNDSLAVKNQYRTAENLNTRISIHSKYSTNRQGFGNWIVSQYRILPGMSVLELGCGTGQMTRRLRDAGYDMIGIDNSIEMLDIAR